MPNRAQRRAAQRQTQKLAVQASKVMLAEQAQTGRPETMSASASIGGSEPQHHPTPSNSLSQSPMPVSTPTEPTRSIVRAPRPTKARPNPP